MNILLRFLNLRKQNAPFFTAVQNLRGFFPQNSCPGSFHFFLDEKLRSNSSAAASFTW